MTQGGPSNYAAVDHFSPSKIKDWALDDLNKTISWLESQDEKVNCLGHLLVYSLICFQVAELNILHTRRLEFTLILLLLYSIIWAIFFFSII